MANPILFSTAATGTFVFGLDWMVNPFNVNWLLTFSATGSATLNSTLDPINPTVGAGYGVLVAPNPTWTVLSGTWPATANAAGSITTPIQALQLVITANTGTISLKIIQSSAII